MIFNADCLDYMKTMESNSIDFIVTDPPYGLKFMGKKWDHGIPGIEIWKEALRVCKPGAWMAAFGGTRTYHRLACAIEDAGWEIRDCMMWLYGSGFPKSHNHFGLEGYGTALKPAYEPILLAMKPLDETFAQNVEKWGIGGINIESSRIGTKREVPASHSKNKSGISLISLGKPNSEELNPNKGRWPANLILDEEVGEILDEQSGILKSGSLRVNINHESKNKIYGKKNLANINEFYQNSGGASRFFYCAKASPKERQGSTHPTMKPLALMRYIIKLLAPPNDPLVLDPFAGSGSTLVAAKELGIRSVGIEKEAEYCAIAKKRLVAVNDLFNYDLEKPLRT